jgi:hypothetical protein
MNRMVYRVRIVLRDDAGTIIEAHPIADSAPQARIAALRAIVDLGIGDGVQIRRIEIVPTLPARLAA